MMTIKKYVFLASTFFLLGLVVLYFGFNRVPFNQNVPHMTHPMQSQTDIFQYSV